MIPPRARLFLQLISVCGVVSVAWAVIDACFGRPTPLSILDASLVFALQVVVNFYLLLKLPGRPQSEAGGIEVTPSYVAEVVNVLVLGWPRAPLLTSVAGRIDADRYPEGDD